MNDIAQSRQADVLRRKLKHPGLLISASWIDGAESAQPLAQPFAVINPANGHVLAQVAPCQRPQLLQAEAAAARAFATWQYSSGRERAEGLLRWYELIIEHLSDLALLLSLEQGKPLSEARAEIIYGARYIQWFSEQAKRLGGDWLQGAAAGGQQICVSRHAVGVVAAITPWNFPMAMLARKLAPAIAAGCAVLVKPAEATPLSALALGVLATEAGLPNGLVNILVTDSPAAVGEFFCQSEQVKKLTFTGSTATGRWLQQQCAPSLKRTSMELGGNAPFIIFDDADLDLAIQHLLACKFRNAGQTCISANRIFVQENIYTQVQDKIIAGMQRLVVGCGQDSGVDIGPLIHQPARDRINQLVTDALDAGAKCIYQGAVPEDHMHSGGYYVALQLIVDVTSEMALDREEIFAPVLALQTFVDEADVMARANRIEAGLAAYVFTQNHRRIWRLQQQLQVGMLGINEAAISNEMAPFGGVHDSGFGREGSQLGVDDYLYTKTVTLGGLSYLNRQGD